MTEPTGPGMDAGLAALEAETARAARALGQPALAEALERTEQAERPITLVVAGETSRGKSSLINALLGRPGLLATGADVTTNVYTRVGAGPEGATLLLADGEHEVGFDELPAWTSVDGVRPGQPAVAGADVRLGAPLLDQGLVLVDTPGVGGLDAGQARMTLVALGQADALLFVLDARAPISGPERAFLEQASERIETVIFALTKIDMFPGWDTVRRQDVEFLARHVPRFASAAVVPVSPQLATHAEELAAMDPRLAATLRAKGGIEALRALIERRVVAPGAQLRRANRVRAVLSAVERLLDGVAATRASASGDDRYEAELVTTRARVEQHRSNASAWGIKLADEFSLLRAEANRILSLELIGIENDLATLNDASQLEAMPAQLEARLASALLRVNAALADGIADIGTSLAADLNLDGVTLDVPALRGVGAPAQLVASDRSESGPEAAVSVGRLVFSSTGPLMFINMVSSFAPALGPLAPVGLVVGLAMGLVDRSRINRTSNLNAAQRQWTACLRRTLNPARIDLTVELDQRLLEVRRRMEAQVKSAVEQRSAELRDELERLSSLRAKDADVRRIAIERADDNERGLAILAARARSLRDAAVVADGASRLSALVATSGSSSPSPIASPPAVPDIPLPPTSRGSS